MQRKVFKIISLLLLCVFYLLTKEETQISIASIIPSEKKVIVIDAGHGGDDPGVIGLGGIREKDINLQVALKLKVQLDKKYKVYLTRSNDTGLYDEAEQNKKVQDLQRRISFIKEKKPDLTLSIHQNSYPQNNVKGPQLFYYADSVQGKRLAECIQRNMNDHLHVSRPRVAKGNTSYYLLKHSQGVLNIVECGFLTNEDEAKLLQEEEYQHKIAEAVSKGVEEFFENFEK